MSIRTREEERERREQRIEREEILGKFAGEMFKMFKIWIRMDALFMVILMLVYLFLVFVRDWDFFYDTDIKGTTIFLLLFTGSSMAVIVCGLVALFLYNTKHKRDTKYEPYTHKLEGNGKRKWGLKCLIKRK